MHDTTIAEMVLEYAQRSPEQLCVVDESAARTYGWMSDTARGIARALLGGGVKKGERVMVRCSQDAAFLATDLACQLAGIIFVPVEKEASAERVLEIGRDTEAVRFIGDAVEGLSCQHIDYEELLARAAEDERKDIELPATQPDETAQILYTTGTTGKSKGIEITHANNIALAQNISGGTQMQRGNVEYIPLPLSHSHGLRCAYANLYMNGTLLLTDGVRNVKGIYDMLRTYHATAMDISPTAANVFLRLFKKVHKELNEQLAYIQIGTAALPEQLKQQLCEAFPNVRLYNFYGSTESGRSCVLDFNIGEERRFCVGKPTRNARFIVTDEQRREIASSPEHTGLLACAGAMNMKGYWRQPELTREIMRDGYVFTNDEAYIDGDGYVYVLGRKDDVINYMGIKIAPEEIEEVAAGYDQVLDCACVPRPDKAAGQVPWIFIQAKDPETFDKKAFTDYLAGRIDSNKLPRQVELIDEIPRTPNGKLQRKKLAIT